MTQEIYFHCMAISEIITEYCLTLKKGSVRDVIALHCIALMMIQKKA